MTLDQAAHLESVRAGLPRPDPDYEIRLVIPEDIQAMAVIEGLAGNAYFAWLIEEQPSMFQW